MFLTKGLYKKLIILFIILIDLTMIINMISAKLEQVSIGTLINQIEGKVSDGRIKIDPVYQRAIVSTPLT